MIVLTEVVVNRLRYVETPKLIAAFGRLLVQGRPRAHVMGYIGNRHPQTPATQGALFTVHGIVKIPGITKSLFMDAQNFILHFRKKSSIEMQSEARDEILDLIQQVYWLKFNQKNEKAPKLKIFGVSSKSLTDFVTTEKDLLR